MPGRHASSGDYRYGFNGQEKDDEIKGVTGSHYTAEFWMYDARLGRRWEIDPMTGNYAWQSPYATFNNNPIIFADPLGLEGDNVIESGEVKAPEGATVEFSEGDITKGSQELEEFTINGGADPTKAASDNTSPVINVDTRSLKDKRRTNNNAFFNNQLVNNPKLVGSLISRTSSLSNDDKSAILFNYMQNGPAGRFYKAFAQEVLMAAGTMGMSSAFAGARRTLGTAIADNMGIANSYSHWGTTQIRFTFGKDVFKYGPKAPPTTTYTTTLKMTSSAEVYEKMALNFTKTGGIRNPARANYYINQYKIKGFYLEGTIGKQGTTLGGGIQITPLNSVFKKGLVGITK